MKQALAKLRVPVDWFSSPERIHREALGLEWLARLAPPGSITPLLFEDREHHLLAMQAVPQPHENWKSVLLGGRISDDHFRQFATLLATIHREAYRKRGDLAEVFGGLARSSNRCGWSPITPTPRGRRRPPPAFWIRSFATHWPAASPWSHGDYSPKNVLIHEGRLVLLDHEVIHFGDPAFDLGFSLTHFLSKAHHLPALRREFAAAAGKYWRVLRGTRWARRRGPRIWSRARCGTRWHACWRAWWAVRRWSI